MTIKRFLKPIAGAALASAVFFTAAQQANGLVVGAVEENKNLFFAGLALTFIIPPLGIVLNGDSAVQDVYKKLPWLKGTHEGRQIQELIGDEIQSSVTQVERKTKKHTDQDQRQKVAEQVMSAQQHINIDKKKKRFTLQLSEQKVRQILEDKDYEDAQVEQAVQQLCH